MAIKKSRGQIKAAPFLTPGEKGVKKHVYRLAHAANVHVEDRGDMLVIKSKQGGGLQHETHIHLNMTNKDIMGHIQRVQGNKTSRHMHPPHRLTHHVGGHQPRATTPMPASWSPPHQQSQSARTWATWRQPGLARQATTAPWRQLPQAPPAQGPVGKAYPPPLSAVEVTRLRQLLAGQAPLLPPPPHRTNPVINQAASAQLALALGLHPHVQGQQQRRNPW